MTSSPLSRRRALSGAATVGLSLPLLAACGDDGGGSATDGSPSEAPTSNAPSTSDTSEPSAEPSDGGGADGVVSTADVPVGSGVILGDDGVVVTQPTEGEFHVVSSTCTHSGCTVTGITDTITCPCHGSSFDLTGAVVGGPAPSPLPEVGFSVEGDQVVLT